MDNRGVTSIILAFILVVVVLIAIFTLFYFEAITAEAEISFYENISGFQKADNMAESIENCFDGISTGELLLAESGEGEDCIKEPFSGYTVDAKPVSGCSEKIYRVGAWDECKSKYSYAIEVQDSDSSQVCVSQIVVCIDGVRPPEPPKLCLMEPEPETITCGSFGDCREEHRDPDDPDNDLCRCQPGLQTCEGEQIGFGPCEGALDPIAEICDNGIDDDCNGEIDEDCDIVFDEDTICVGEGQSGRERFSDWVSEMAERHIWWSAGNPPYPDICDFPVLIYDGVATEDGHRSGYAVIKTPDLPSAGWYDIAFAYSIGNQHRENMMLECKDQSGGTLKYYYWDEGSEGFTEPPGGRDPDPNNTAPPYTYPHPCSNDWNDIYYDGEIILKNSDEENIGFWTHEVPPTILESPRRKESEGGEGGWNKCYFQAGVNEFKLAKPDPLPCGGNSIRIIAYKIRAQGG